MTIESTLTGLTLTGPESAIASITLTDVDGTAHLLDMNNYSLGGVSYITTGTGLTMTLPDTVDSSVLFTSNSENTATIDGNIISWLFTGVSPGVEIVTVDYETATRSDCKTVRLCVEAC